MAKISDVEALHNSARRIITDGYNLFIAGCPNRANLFRLLIDFNKVIRDLGDTSVETLARIGKLAAYFHARASRTPVPGSSVFKSFEPELTDLDRQIDPVLRNSDTRVSIAYQQLMS